MENHKVLSKGTLKVYSKGILQKNLRDRAERLDVRKEEIGL
jgi:hypothetical protein